MTLLALFKANQQPPQSPEISQQHGIKTSSYQDMVALVNAQRVEQGLPQLVEHEALRKSATAKACDMVNREYFGHRDPEGREAWHFFEEKGFEYVFAGENLIESFVGDEAAMAELMASPEHRANILSPNYTHVGVGRCDEITVQHFGTLRVE